MPDDEDLQNLDLMYDLEDETEPTPSRSAPTLFTAAELDRFNDWPVWLVAGSTFVSGLVGIVQPLLTRLSQHPKLFDAVVPYELYHLSKSFTVFFALTLIYLSFNLFHRKRVAWLIAILISAGFAFLQFLRIGIDHLSPTASHFVNFEIPSYSCLPPIFACLLLIVLRKNFQVKSEIDSIKFAVVSSVISLCAALAYGTLGFWLLDKVDFGVNFSAAEALLRTINEIIHVGNYDLIPRTKFALWFMQSLQIVGFATPAFIFFSLFRPLTYKLQTLPKERAIADDLLEKYGRTSLDRYKLFADKSYYFSAGNRSFIAYKTAMNVAVALSDPTGPVELLYETIVGFKKMCNANGWICAFMQTTPECEDIYRQAGMNSLKIGEDGIVDLEKFCTVSVTRKTFKTPLKKLDKEGCKVICKAPPQTDETIKILAEISDEWLSLPGRRERGFSLGQFDAVELKRDHIFELVDSNGRAIAFVNRVRSYCKDETTIDLMRHRVQVPNGAMDYLFVRMLIELRAQGYKFFSLGLAALSGVGDDVDATLHERAVHEIYERLNRFFSYKGLRKYKEKFDPRWEDRFLIYEGGTTGLVRTALAISKATED